MDITITWDMVAWALGLVVAWSASLIGVIKYLIGRMIMGIDDRLDANNQECSDKWTQLENRQNHFESRYMKFLERLPIEYQRREDSIREYTAINAKLDRLYELVLEKIKK